MALQVLTHVPNHLTRFLTHASGALSALSEIAGKSERIIGGFPVRPGLDVQLIMSFGVAH